jgi:hypothetical protein
MENFPYCIPYFREVTGEELEILKFLTRDLDEITVELESLTVIARCGCGQCPSILFGLSPGDEPVTGEHAEHVASWQGRTTGGTLAGVFLLAKDGMPTELEWCSLDGGDDQRWPPIENLVRL